MIEKIIPDKISFTLPTVFGEELTFLEFCGRVRAKLNECIDVVNDKTATIDQFTARIDANAANINTVSDKAGKNTADIQKNATAIATNTTNIQKNATAIATNTTNIQKNATAIATNTTNIQKNATAISANQSNIAALSGKVDKNMSDIQQNTETISDHSTSINTLLEKVADNILTLNQHETSISANASNIQQNTSAISANESSIEAINTAFNALRNDFLNKKVESLFAPVILNVENHGFGADINASVYVRLGRIDWQGLGCLYAKINLSFSGATDAKTLKINSVQFGDRKAANIDSVSTSFTAKTDVINLPISIVGTSDIPVGTSDIAVTGVNLLGMSIAAESLSSSFSLDSIPTGLGIPCESLTFTSPAGGEEDSKIVYTFKASEGCFDIFTTAAGIPGISERASLQTDFTSIISNQKVFSQFLCSGGAYNSNTISTVPDNGASLGAALINYTEFDGDGAHVYTARTTLRTINAAGISNLLKNTGIASQPVPYGEFAQISLTFDMFN